MVKLEVGKYYLSENDCIVKVLSKENERFKTTAGTYDEKGSFSCSNDAPLVYELPNFDGEVQYRHMGTWKDVKVGLVKIKKVGVYLDGEHYWVNYSELRNKPRIYTQRYWVVRYNTGAITATSDPYEAKHSKDLVTVHSVVPKEEVWES